MPFATSISVLISCSVAVAAFEVNQMQYYFWFKDKIHKNWIIDSIEDIYMITCFRYCQINSDCNGLALGPLEENLENHKRTCLLLAGIDELECDQDYNCSREGFQVYLQEKPLTTTTTTTTVAPTTTTITTTTEEETTTTTTTTTTEAPTTTTTTTEPPTTTLKPTTTTTTTEPPTTTITTTTKEPTTTEQTATTTTTQAPSTTSTAEPTTTTTETPTTTTTEVPTTTTEAPTTTTEAPTTTTTEVPTTTATEVPTTTTTEVPTTITTEVPTTTTEAPTTTTIEAPTTTTIEEPTTTTETPTTTTTTTEVPTTTTTTTEAPTTTTTTTEAPTTTTTEQATTTLEPTTTTEGEVEDCKAPPANIVCDEPKTQFTILGIKSNAPLFTDADMKVQCKKFMNNIFKSSSSKTAYRPFSGQFTCAEDEAMTGFELCFQVDLIYIAPFCTGLEPGYTLKVEGKDAKSSPAMPSEVTCPDESAMISIKLEKDDEGNMSVYITCAAIVKE